MTFLTWPNERSWRQYLNNSSANTSYICKKPWPFSQTNVSTIKDHITHTHTHTHTHAYIYRIFAHWFSYLSFGFIQVVLQWEFIDLCDSIIDSSRERREKACSCIMQRDHLVHSIPSIFTSFIFPASFLCVFLTFMIMILLAFVLSFSTFYSKSTILDMQYWDCRSSFFCFAPFSYSLWDFRKV